MLHYPHKDRDICCLYWKENYEWNYYIKIRYLIKFSRKKEWKITRTYQARWSEQWLLFLQPTEHLLPIHISLDEQSLSSRQIPTQRPSKHFSPNAQSLSSEQPARHRPSWHKWLGGQSPWVIHILTIRLRKERNWMKISVVRARRWSGWSLIYLQPVCGSPVNKVGHEQTRVCAIMVQIAFVPQAACEQRSLHWWRLRENMRLRFDQYKTWDKLRYNLIESGNWDEGATWITPVYNP